MLFIVFCVTMPGNSKKTPISKTRKRVTASARARISTKRVRKEVTTDNSGSYLQDPVVNTVNLNQPGPSTSGSSNEQIMALLLKLDESNKALMARMDKTEQRPSLDSTPVIPWSHSLKNQALNDHLSHNHPPVPPTQAVKFQETGMNGDVHQRQHLLGIDNPISHNTTAAHLSSVIGHTSVNPRSRTQAGETLYYQVCTYSGVSLQYQTESPVC